MGKTMTPQGVCSTAGTRIKYTLWDGWGGARVWLAAGVLGGVYPRKRHNFLGQNQSYIFRDVPRIRVLSYLGIQQFFPVSATSCFREERILHLSLCKGHWVTVL